MNQYFIEFLNVLIRSISNTGHLKKKDFIRDYLKLLKNLYVNSDIFSFVPPDNIVGFVMYFEDCKSLRYEL